MSDDAFGDRMKSYEMAEAGRRLMSDRIPVLARLDGRCFSGFTAGLQRPFDPRLTALMVETTVHLVEETGAAVGYTQSDEISLGWYAPDFKSQIWFDGRVQKMTSVLAAEASVFFNRGLAAHLPEKRNEWPVFDCRVWNVPNLDEAVNAFLWREQDATKNSVQMACRYHYPHKEVFGKPKADMHQMLFDKGVNWADYPASFKRGTYVRRVTVTGRPTPDELDALPPKHHARTDPDFSVSRSKVTVLDLPPLARVANRPGVLFLGEAPVLAAPTPEAS